MLILTWLLQTIGIVGKGFNSFASKLNMGIYRLKTDVFYDGCGLTVMTCGCGPQKGSSTLPFRPECSEGWSPL